MLYACDKPWWAQYAEEARASFAGEMWSTSQLSAREYELQYVPSRMGRTGTTDSISRGRNSGHQALSLAVMFGASRVVLLGYDFQKTGGQTHWHGNHPQPLGNLGDMRAWIRQMGELAREISAAGVDVVNATRETALACFPRETLERALV